MFDDVGIDPPRNNYQAGECKCACGAVMHSPADLWAHIAACKKFKQCKNCSHPVAYFTRTTLMHVKEDNKFSMRCSQCNCQKAEGE